MTFTIECHVYDPRPDYPLLVTANRYWDPQSQQEDGFILLLGHATGFHKEQWEPTLKHLFALSKGSSAFPIREAWSIECPNHGESAVLNEATLHNGGYNNVAFSWGEYTHAIWLFITQYRRVQFSDQRFIAIGHSMGAICLAMTQTYTQAPSFSCIVMCEPTVIPPTIAKHDPAQHHGISLGDMAVKRKDIWPSKKDAYETLKTRRAYANWDDEVLRIFVEKGMRSLPTATYPELKDGVTLKCSKFQERVTLRDNITIRRTYEYLPTLCTNLPVHIIWGGIDDQLRTDLKQLVTDVVSLFKKSSVSRVPGAGHFIIQTAPKAVAQAIFAVVAKEPYISKL